MLEFIRDGHYSVAELMDKGRRILGRRHVLKNVPQMIHHVQIEGTFPDGTKLVTVHDPISTEDGDIHAALYGSFLPIPDIKAFPSDESMSDHLGNGFNFHNYLFYFILFFFTHSFSIA